MPSKLQVPPEFLTIDGVASLSISNTALLDDGEVIVDGTGEAIVGGAGLSVIEIFDLSTATFSGSSTIGRLGSSTIIGSETLITGVADFSATNDTGSLFFDGDAGTAAKVHSMSLSRSEFVERVFSATGTVGHYEHLF